MSPALTMGGCIAFDRLDLVQPGLGAAKSLASGRGAGDDRTSWEVDDDSAFACQGSADGLRIRARLRA